MRNAKNVSFWQIDHKVKNIFSTKEIEVLTSPKAWEKLKWTRKYFSKKPKEGYFLWVKREVNFPLLTCVALASTKVSQNLTNLLVIEKGLRVKANAICQSLKNNLCGIHKAKGKFVLKEGAILKYTHFHRWGKKDFVSSDYELILQKNSKLIYLYKNFFPPKNLFLKITIQSGIASSANLDTVVNSQNSKVGLLNIVNLRGKNSEALVKLRLVGRKNSQIEALGQIKTFAPSKGHLDCQGLLVDKMAKISLIPRLVCQNKKALLTHEASIGKILQEQLTYLRMRGLTEKGAIDLIVSGFLK